jgi:hypothetical protein
MPFKSQAQRRKFAELLVERKDLTRDFRRVEPGDCWPQTTRACSRCQESEADGGE